MNWIEQRVVEIEAASRGSLGQLAAAIGKQSQEKPMLWG